MRMVRTIAAWAALAIAPAWTAHPAEAAKLLRLNGHLVKWGKPVAASGATVTYAFADGYHEDRLARNCRRMTRFTSSEMGLHERDIHTALTSALTVWEKAADIRFVAASDPSTADILIGIDADSRGTAFANVRLLDDRAQPALVTSEAMKRALSLPGITAGHPLRGHDREVSSARTLSFAPIAKARICLNSQEVWKTAFDGDSGTYDLRYVFTHEIGHAIGLDHPGPVGGVMGFRYVEGSYDLHASDIAAAREIYGPPRRRSLSNTRPHDEAARRTAR